MEEGIGMRRNVLFTVLVTWALWGAVAISAPPPVSAVPISVPPTVNATNWSEVGQPELQLPPGAGNIFEAVSCTSASFCVATGETGATSGTLIEQFSGIFWTPVTTPPEPGGAVLPGVSCVGQSFCAAVGAVDDSILIEQWNGAAWLTVSAPEPPSATASQFFAVSCPSSTDCIAVGSAQSGSTTVPLVEQWNGSSWTIVLTPAPAASTDSELRGVSCSEPALCVAVGESEGASSTSTLVEQWNGTAWSIVSSPDGSDASGASNTLSGVSCVGSSFCQAVGTFNDGVNPGRTLAETWNGTTWTLVPSPNESPTEADSLSGVDCFGTTTCSAVGQSDDPSTGFDPLAIAWSGSTWSVVPNPSLPAGTVQTLARAVSCVTNWGCVAVGSTNSGSVDPFVMSASIARSGYRFVASDGGVFNYGAGAPFLGSMGGTHLNQPIVGMAVMPAGDGYDLVASDGGLFTFGSAQFYGSTGSLHLNKPVVGMALTADGAGYWLVASDGGIFSYGDAQFYGSAGSLMLYKPIVGMAATPDGKGYWLVASDGGIFSYGDAVFQGSTGGIALNKPVVGMAANSTGAYYLVASDGGVFNFPGCRDPRCTIFEFEGPAAPFEGSAGSLTLNKPIVGIDAVGGGYFSGYYLSGSDGGVFSYPTTNGPPFRGSTGSIALDAPIVGIAG